MIRHPTSRIILARALTLVCAIGVTAGPAAAHDGLRVADARTFERIHPHSAPATRPLVLGGGRLPFVVRRRDVAAAAPVERRSGSAVDLERAQRDDRNAWAEPVYRTRAAATPGAALRPSQDAQFTAPGDDGFRAAWEDTAGAPALRGNAPIIAIIDSGVDVTHPDLAQNLWTNPGEIPGNQTDDDRNGYVDDVHGTDIIAPGTAPDDEYYHGTAVAGVAAARGEDGQGVTGVAWVSRIMAVRVLDADGGGDTGQLADGILYAVANGAQVLNVSITSDARTRAVDDAIAEAERRGVVLVAAAGNEGRDLADGPVYPASSESPAVLSVAATESRSVLASWSNHGRTGVDIAAPGADLLTTLPGGSYAGFSGTSAAAPVVSGTAALMRAAQPLAALAQIRATLMETAERSPVPVRSGELRAGSALAAFAPLDIGRVAQADPGVPSVTVTSRILQGTGIRRRARITWTLARSSKPAARQSLHIHRRTASGPLLRTGTRNQTGTSGALTSSSFRALTSGRTGAYVIEVRVTAADGTVLGTGRQVRRFR